MFPVSHLPPSNAGGQDITQKALDFWNEGRDREEMELKDLETVLTLSVFNNNKSEYKLAEYFFVLLCTLQSLSFMN